MEETLKPSSDRLLDDDDDDCVFRPIRICLRIVRCMLGYCICNLRYRVYHNVMVS